MSASITVTGRLTRDMEKQSDSAPYKTAVAVDGLEKHGSEYKTKFFNLTVWAPKADGLGGSPAYDLIARMGAKGNVLKKGTLVMVTGTPTYEVTEREGQTVNYDGIKATDIRFVQEARRDVAAGSEVVSDDSTAGIDVDDETAIPLL